MLLVLLSLTLPATAGPWVHPEGEGYAKLGYTRFAAEQGFVDGAPTGLSLRAHSLDAYVELGLPAQLQVIAALPLVRAINVAPDGTRYTHTWTGDLRLALERSLSQRRPLALGLEARLPTYRNPEDYSRVSGLDDIYLDAIAAQFPQLGDRSVDLSARLMAGASSSRAWIAAEAGPRYRFGGYAAGLAGALNAGLWLVPERAGLSLYSAGNLNLTEAEEASRQLLQVRGSAFVAGLGAAGLTLEAWGGGVVLAEYAATGFDLGLGLSRTFERER